MGHNFHHEALSAEAKLLYETATQQIRQGLAQGNTYEEACRRLNHLEPTFKAYVFEDFLKILIAEEHLGNNAPIDDLALLLGLPYETMTQAVNNLLEEIAWETAADFPSGPVPGPATVFH